MPQHRTSTSVQPGEVRNPWGPAGKPSSEAPATQRDVTMLARKYTKRAVKQLVKIMEDPNETGGARVNAAKEVLSRGWGQSAQTRLDIVANLTDRELESAAREVLARREAEQRRLSEQREKLTLDATFSDERRENVEISQ